MYVKSRAGRMLIKASDAQALARPQMLRLKARLFLLLYNSDSSASRTGVAACDSRRLNAHCIHSVWPCHICPVSLSSQLRRSPNCLTGLKDTGAIHHH
jgi:hypothetical protein